MEWLKLFREFGLIGLIFGAIFFLLFLIIKWTLNTTKDILTQAAKERENWHSTIEKVNASIEKNCVAIDRHDEKAEERGRYVRAEHERMIANLDEQGKVLVRINGYKP